MLSCPRSVRRILAATLLIAGGLAATSEADPSGAESPRATAGAASGTIVFQRERVVRGTNLAAEIWAVDGDGTALRRLTRFSAKNGSGDGTASIARGRVAFLRNIGSRNLIYRVAERGGTPRRVARLRRFARAVTQSASGRTLAFSRPTRRDDGGPTGLALWTIRADGTGQRKLSRNSGLRADDSPSFSPDGKTVAFVRRSTGRRSGQYARPSASIVVVDVATRRERTVLPAEDFVISGPRFSPDGARLIFGCNEGEDVCVVNADGTSRSVVVDAAGTTVGSTGAHGAASPTAAWSPDGTKIVFDCGRELRTLCVASADGTGRRVLVRGSRPDWG